MAAHRSLIRHYGAFFSEPTTEHGLRPDGVTDPVRLYTNNWPSEPLVANTPTANVMVSSVASLVALLGGVGILFAAFGRWGRSLGWHGREQATLSFRKPGDVALPPAQRATAWFFFVMAALFLLQTLVGAAAQHYRADLTGFFGLDLAKWLPYNLTRTWHVQLAHGRPRREGPRPAEPAVDPGLPQSVRRRFPEHCGRAADRHPPPGRAQCDRLLGARRRSDRSRSG